MIELILPYPPSINAYWKHAVVHAKGRARPYVYISEEGKAFRKAVHDIMRIKRISILKEKGLFVEVYLTPPDNRKRDIDNPIKILLDSLQHAGVYEDDCQINRLYIERLSPEKNESNVSVKISSYSD